MIALLIVAIVLIVINIAFTTYFYWKEYKGTIELETIFKLLTTYFKQTCDKLDSVESKMNGLPYKKRQRKTKPTVDAEKTNEQN